VGGSVRVLSMSPRKDFHRSISCPSGTTRNREKTCRMGAAKRNPSSLFKTG
jgi:hypothetical protein